MVADYPGVRHQSRMSQKRSRPAGTFVWVRTEDDMREMRGSCLCGQVRYSATAEPALVAVCHCKNCQKQAGTAFTVVVGIPKSALSIDGHLKTYHDKGDSGQAVLR